MVARRCLVERQGGRRWQHRRTLDAEGDEEQGKRTRRAVVEGEVGQKSKGAKLGRDNVAVRYLTNSRRALLIRGSLLEKKDYEREGGSSPFYLQMGRPNPNIQPDQSGNICACKLKRCRARKEAVDGTGVSLWHERESMRWNGRLVLCVAVFSSTRHASSCAINV